LKPMCQAIPRPVLEVTAERARVVVDGEEMWVDRRAVPELQAGDYVVVYAGAALERMPEDEALEMIRFYEDFESMLAEGTERLFGPDTAQAASPAVPEPRA
jgi:hydrogenase expression/formation protein HypC